MAGQEMDEIRPESKKRPRIDKDPLRAKQNTESAEAAASEAANVNEPAQIKERLDHARKIRAEAKTVADLEEVKVMLRSILQDAKAESSEWTDAGSFLATLLLQQHDNEGPAIEEASRLLQERGFLYRLSRMALRQPKHVVEQATSVPSPPSHLAHAFDNMLPKSLTSALWETFCPSSSYWSSHNYSDGSTCPPSPYFSYVVALDKNDNDSVLQSYLRHVQHHVSRFIPGVADCPVIEFWAHCRPHSSGHQLHFDSDDEGRGGVLRHPVASTVLYLSDDDTNTAVGGATLVTTQTSKNQKLATQGWLCHARQNRLLAFAGNRLHGVLPGVGVPPALYSTSPTSSARRVTFMVAFWKRIRVQDEEGPGAARPFSRAENESWARPLMKHHHVPEKDEHMPSLSTDCFVPVPVWEDVDEEANKLQSQSLDQVHKQRLLPPYDLFFQFYS